MIDTATVILSPEQAEELCFAAACRVGAAADAARSIARAAVAAEAEGQTSVGLVHFLDYLDAFRAGRIKAGARPILSRPLPAIIHSDAQGGVAHLGFDLAFEDMVSSAQAIGVSIFSQCNAFTCGSLGYFASRLADQGLVALAATNGPALMAGSGSTRPVFCTNPMAFAAPSDQGLLVIDQASSATAFVKIREAARRGEPIPSGWAIDRNGDGTTDPKEAIEGALLAFGGWRGANVALMVEVLAAGMTGANWSLDAPSFIEGSASPGAGLFVLAIEPKCLDPDFGVRLSRHLDRLSNEYGVHIPGASRQDKRAQAASIGLKLSRTVVAALEAAASGES